MKRILGLILLFISVESFAGAYIGGSYGYGMLSSEPLEEYKVTPKGFNYGGFFGIGRDFVGLEVFYQDLKSAGKIKHEGGNYDLNANAKALGAALRFSFEVMYLRLGFARYTLDQSVDIEDESTRETAEAVYEIQENESKNGVLFGIGLHRKLGNSVRAFVDYSRYQITGIGHYDTFSVGFAFSIPDRYLNVGRH